MPAYRSVPRPRTFRVRGTATAALASAGAAALALTVLPAQADGAENPGTVSFDLRAADIPGQRPASDGNAQRTAERAELATETGSVLAGAAERRHADAVRRAGAEAEAARAAAEAERAAEQAELSAVQAAAPAMHPVEPEETVDPIVPAEPEPVVPAEPEPAAPAYTDDLDGWIREALDIMAANGIPGTYDGLHRNIMRESSGDPNAINLWDINAMNGTPSIGLLQVIQPTFDAYYVEDTPYDIYDPVANIVAAANYAADRYGSIDNVFGAY
ncbi:transglycosylase SLT domain-containing protein [Streptomyces sp. URMC 129]|uniref:transglycosylase SLT domain-containing protein n=1 Tax=Streptomyces sp. URMC 129 TaxID=3423407 RepID=UPI003F19A622